MNCLIRRISEPSINKNTPGISPGSEILDVFFLPVPPVRSPRSTAAERMVLKVRTSVVEKVGRSRLDGKFGGSLLSRSLT